MPSGGGRTARSERTPVAVEQLFGLLLVAAVFAGFLSELNPLEVTALAASALLLATGIV